MEQTYIAIMIQSLEKKEQVLDKIIELDTVQKNQLEDPNLTPDDFDDVVEQKSKLIEQLDNLDSGFEKLFERVKESYPQNHRQERENPKPGSQKQSPYDKQIQWNKKTGQTSAKGRKCGQQILSVNDKDRICRSTVHG